jgi:RNA polymerase sigma factor (sigma-70 family)
VTENYVRWLAQLYADRTGEEVADDVTIAAGVRILGYHGSRWPAEEDFLSLVASKGADRLRNTNPKVSFPPFLKLLSQTADAVRHSIARQARRRLIHPTSGALEQIASAEMDPWEEAVSRTDLEPPAEATVRALSRKLAAELSAKDQALLTLLFERVPVAKIAEKLNISVRTVRRRIAEIKRQL